MRIKATGRRSSTGQRYKMKTRFFFGRKILDENGLAIRYFGWTKARWSSNKAQWVLYPAPKNEEMVVTIAANDAGSADTTARFTDNQILGGA